MRGRSTTVSDQPAIEVQGILEIGGQSSHKRSWVLTVGNRLYNLSILSGDEPAAEEDVSKLINSFRLTGVAVP